jgi:hypothetical protein
MTSHFVVAAAFPRWTWRHRPDTMGNVTGEDETEYWLSVVGIRESLAQSEEDIAAGRTYGEADVRALLVDKRAE